MKKLKTRQITKDIDEIRAFYKDSDCSGKQLLEKIFGKRTFQNVTESDFRPAVLCCMTCPTASRTWTLVPTLPSPIERQQNMQQNNF